MNDSTEYAKMLEIPVSSCEYVYKRKKRLFSKKKIMKKVNADLSNAQSAYENAVDSADENVTQAVGGNAEEQNPEKFRAGGFFRSQKRGRDNDLNADGKRAGKKPDIITVQVAAVFVLAIAIILTNIFWDNSGMNTLFRSVFGITAETRNDDRVYSEFALAAPVKTGQITLADGIMSYGGECAVYPVCGGSVSKIEKAADGTYTVTIKHSDSFRSVVEGADYVYFAEGDQVNVNIPVCHVASGGKTYLYDEGGLLTCYAVSDSGITWNK